MSRITGSSLSEVHMGTEAEPDPVELDDEKPFRILIAGDFSGRSWRADPAKSFRPQFIDRDNFDEVLEAMQVSVEVHGLTLGFRELEDFHPDRIFQTVPVFQNLDELLNQSAVEPAPAAAPAPRPAAGGLLDAMVEEQGDEPSRPVTAADANDLAGFIRRSLAGHVVPREAPAKQQRAARRQQLAAGLLRGFLHHPRVQAIEAAWRGLFMLVRGLATGENLKIYIVDVSLPELVQHMDAIHKQLRQNKPWGLICGNYIFGQSELDAEVLRRLATMASSLGAPFLAEASPPPGGDPVEAWHKLRKSDLARWLGLALPRFLLRLPYGKDTDATESMPFEEMPESQHNAYLWGNPVFFCAHLIGKSYLTHGPGFAQRLQRRIDGLPLHVYRDEDGLPVAKPCAEVLMTERDAETLLEAGLMPLASLKEQDAALIVRFQSLAEPLSPLAGLS